VKPPTSRVSPGATTSTGTSGAAAATASATPCGPSTGASGNRWCRSSRCSGVQWSGCSCVTTTARTSSRSTSRPENEPGSMTRVRPSSWWTLRHACSCLVIRMARTYPVGASSAARGSAARRAVEEPPAAPAYPGAVPSTRRPADPSMLRADALTALGLAAASVLVGVLASASQMQRFERSLWLVALFSVLVAAPLAWRRRWPVPVLVATSVLYAVGGELGAMEFTVSQVVLFLAFYTVGAWCTNRTLAFRARLATVLAMAVWLLASAIRGFYSPETGEYGVQAFFSWFVIQVMVNAAYFAGAWVFGDRS